MDQHQHYIEKLGTTCRFFRLDHTKRAYFRGQIWIHVPTERPGSTPQRTELEAIIEKKAMLKLVRATAYRYTAV